MPPADSELLHYISATKQAGASDDFVLQLLEQSRWPRKQIFAAFREHYSQLSGVVPPERSRTAESSRDAFLYLLSFSMLATWAWAVGSLLFHFIDGWFHDEVFSGRYNDSLLVPSQMAALLIAFPLYLVLMRTIVKSVQRDPERLLSPVRKWLTYIALLFAAGFLIGDAITFLEYLLRGELSSRFVSKTLTVIVLAGGIFGYYLNSVRSTAVSREKLFALAACVLVLAVIILGFREIGSPATRRAAEADSRRIADLQQISNMLYGKTSLPKTLAELGANRKDPEKAVEYEYHPSSGTSYQLCADFNQPSANTDFWRHPQGHQCFDLQTSELH